jgi:hypothetical protein
MLEMRGRPSSPRVLRLPPRPHPEVRGRSPSLEGEDAGSLEDKGPSLEGEDAGSLEDKGPSLEGEDAGSLEDKGPSLEERGRL